MHVITFLQDQLAAEESYFRQHLLKEDISRLQRLLTEAEAAADIDAFLATAVQIGWTPDDRRTPELRPTLEPFLRAVYAQLRGGVNKDAASDSGAAESDQRLIALWRAFDAHRIEKLVGCLTRVPQPD